jgi:hypothetical protein
MLSVLYRFGFSLNIVFLQIYLFRSEKTFLLFLSIIRYLLYYYNIDTQKIEYNKSKKYKTKIDL